MTLLNEKEVSQRLGVTPDALRKWRYESRGPQYIKVEGAIRYRDEDVDAYLKERTVETGTKS